MSTYDKLKRTSGFTLIELLVVIAIIGILSSVVLASLNGARESSRDARRQTDLNQIRTGLALYRDTQDTYPSSTNVWSELESEGAMTQVPEDPSTNGNYAYGVPSGGAAGGADFCLGTELEAGSSSVPDDNSQDCLTWLQNGNGDAGGYTATDLNYAISS